MNTQRVDNNTNFKALKINPKLRADIAKRGGDYLVSLDNYGKKISDVKLYHVVYDNSIHIPKIFHDSKNVTRDYFAELRNEEEHLGKYYEVPAGTLGDFRSGFFPDVPRVFRKLFGNNAKAKYKEFKKAEIFEQAAQYSRLLEELEVKSMVAEEKAKAEQRFKEAEEKESKIKLERTLDDMLRRYKYEEPAQPEPVKKSWWKKFFG